MKDIYTLIMAGGAGTRFWPRSKVAKPKQYLNIFGDDSLLQSTIKRFSNFSFLPSASPIAICLLVFTTSNGVVTIDENWGCQQGKQILHIANRNHFDKENSDYSYFICVQLKIHVGHYINWSLTWQIHITSVIL